MARHCVVERTAPRRPQRGQPPAIRCGTCGKKATFFAGRRRGSLAARLTCTCAESRGQ